MGTRSAQLHILCAIERGLQFDPCKKAKSKTSGNFNWGTNFNVESDTYDINDMGFLFNNNERSINGFMEYNFFKPFWKFNRAGIGMWTGYSQLYKPAVYTDYGVEVWSYAQTKGFAIPAIVSTLTHHQL